MEELLAQRDAPRAQRARPAADSSSSSEDEQESELAAVARAQASKFLPSSSMKEGDSRAGLQHMHEDLLGSGWQVCVLAALLFAAATSKDAHVLLS